MRRIKKWQWYQSRSQRRGKTSSFRANLQGAWNDRENARLGLAAATLQSDMEKAGELAARDRAERDASQLKYTGEAQKAYERSADAAGEIYRPSGRTE